MAEPSDQPPTPLLRRWQGCLPAAPEVLHRLEQLTGAVLMLLLAGLPFVSRSGLALEILACGLLWLLWSVSTPRTRSLSSWLLLILAVAVISTGWSPVPMAAAKGLPVIELRRSLCPDSPVAHHQSPVVGPTAGRPADRWTAQQRAGARRLYASTEELARWADPASISSGTIRIYGPLGNPNLLAGYLLPSSPWRLWLCCAGEAGGGGSSPPSRDCWGQRLLSSPTAVEASLACWQPWPYWYCCC